MNNNTTQNNRFKKHYSKIENIYIPLPNFDFFHRASNPDGVDTKFIGRTRISNTLKNYLSAKKSLSGSYLITGYRGMGKSSFVGKVIKEIIDEESEVMPTSSSWSSQKTRNIACSLFIASPFIMAIADFILFNNLSSWISQFILLILAITTGGIPFFYILKGIDATLDYSNTTKHNNIMILKFWYILMHPKTILSRKHILYIHLNLGSEIRNERDVLALVGASIKEKFTSFLLTVLPNSYRFSIYRFISSFCISGIAILIFNYGISIINTPGHNFLNLNLNDGLIKSVCVFINEVFINIIKEHYTLAIILGFITSFSLGAIIYKYILLKIFMIILKKIGKPIRTGGQIYQNLKDLCARIDASVDQDNDPYGGINTSIFGITFKQKTTRRYNKATTPEIEQQLIQIIQQINKSWLLNCRFIIVLDELDKINFINDDEKIEKHKYEIPEFSYDTNGFSGSIRNKKASILALLGRLKYFVTTAEAKFVFLSGHELFDAYLADVSDREFSISSTFSGVINVESFFTSDSQVKDVTRMTEIYLMKILMKKDKKGIQLEDYEEDKYRINTYYKEIYKCLESQKKEIEYYDQLEKTIIFIRQFITYLTFISNGAPKKLTTYFEKYVISTEEYDERYNRKEQYIANTIDIVNNSGYLDNNKANYYLAFGYYDQQKIGFIHYIASPIFHTIISPSSEYGDKLLVASSFLIAHIYKHHSSGFSWRNLEYLPELLDNNRTPELRDFINSMFGYLGQMHITKITSGLYHYKFPLRLTEEISVFTKKSEEISAIFNFSLDDSRAVKQYYVDLLAFHEKSNNLSPINLANIHHYLGDLHLANEEYTEAIGQFRLASDILLKEMSQNKKINDPSVTSYIIRYTRAMLKLGLAYEKRNTMDSAYLVYNNLIIKLITHRYIDDKDIPLPYKQERIDNIEIDGWQEKRLILYLSDQEDKTDPIHANKKFIKQIRPEIMEKEENTTVYFWTYGHEIASNFSEYLSPKNLSLIAKLSTFEELRLTYLPILAKLFAVEKQHTGGITKDNIKVAEAEFKNIFLFSNNKDKFLLGVDFFRKLGDILYYKNGNHDFYKNTLDNLFNIWGYNIKSDIFDCCYKHKLKKEVIEKIINNVDDTAICENIILSIDQTYINGRTKFPKDNLIKLITQNPSEQEVLQEINIPPYITDHWISLKLCHNRRKETNTAIKKPCFACKYYNRSLIILGKEIIPDFVQLEGTKALLFLNAILGKELITQRQNEMNQAALTLEAMGNVMFSCSNKNDYIGKKFIEAFSKYTSSDKFILNTKLNQLEKAILYYWAASEYHYKALNIKEGVQCIIKILNLLVVYYDGLATRLYKKTQIINISDEPDSSNHTNIIPILVKNIETVFIKKAIQGIYSNKDFYSLQEIRKIKEIFNKNNANEEENNFISFGFLSCMPDIEELLLAFYEIQITLSRIPSKLKYKNSYQIDDKIISDLYHSIPLTYLRNDSLIYNRIISLLFKSNLNTYMLERLLRNNNIIKIVSISKNKQNTTFQKWLLERIDHNTVNQIINCISPSQSSRENSQENIFDLLEFLITDSIFCLLQISELILPSFRTTLFTNNFCASIYNNLNLWNELKYRLEKIYIDEYPIRKESFSKLNESFIDDHLKYMQTPIYLLEMKAKFEQKSLEMHREGNSYQDFIDGFYILDDDLQNNSCQYYLALERYKINIGIITDDENLNDHARRGSYNPINYFKMNTKMPSYIVSSKNE